MRLFPRHTWTVTPEQAIALQNTLASEIISNRPIDVEAVQLVAGVDVSVKGEHSQAVWSCCVFQT